MTNRVCVGSWCSGESYSHVIRKQDVGKEHSPHNREHPSLCAMSVRGRCAWSRDKAGQRCGAKAAWSRRPAGLGSWRPCRTAHEHMAHGQSRERPQPKRSAVLRSPAAATAGARVGRLSTSWRPVEWPVRAKWCQLARVGTCDGAGISSRAAVRERVADQAGPDQRPSRTWALYLMTAEIERRCRCSRWLGSLGHLSLRPPDSERGRCVDVFDAARWCEH